MIGGLPLTTAAAAWHGRTAAVAARLQGGVGSRFVHRNAATCLAVLLSLGAGFDYARALDIVPELGWSLSAASLPEDECSQQVVQVVQPDDVTDESLVEAVWEIVNSVFLDARGHNWSQDAWLAEKDKALKAPLENRAAAYSAIRRMLSTLDDPFTRFLTPTEFARMSKYDITGVGLNIGDVPSANGELQVKVIGVILDSPAQLAGFQEGDEIISVDGNPVVGKSAFQVASAIQGGKGTRVVIQARHAGCPSTREYVLYREQERKLQSPVLYRLERSDDADQRRGYIRLKEFNALTKLDLVTAIERLKAAGATSFVLDLRDNLGGLVQEGIEVAKLFLKDGDTVVYTARRDPASSKQIVSKGEPLVGDPLVVLVNNRTASASEIVAAALRDNCRAVLVGTKTFGKGLIQSVYELNDGSGVVLTVGKYVSPRHQDIDGNGIQPDFKKPPGLLELERRLRTCQARLNTMD